MSFLDRLKVHVKGIYGAATDEARWPSVLEGLADEFGGGVAGIHYREGLQGTVRRARFVRMNPEIRRRVLTTMSDRNPWSPLVQPRYRPGVVIALDDLMPLSKLMKTDYYDQVVRPCEVAHAFGACMLKLGDDSLSFTVVRGRTAGPFASWQLRQVEPLLPHLYRAVQVNERLRRAREMKSALVEGLEALRHGIVVVDRHARVVFANLAARRFVAAADGLRITPDGLSPTHRGERLRFCALLRDALETVTRDGHGAGGGMTVSRPSGRHPFIVLVAPLSFPLGVDAPGGLATVFISDTSASAGSIQEMWLRDRGLTTKERQLALAFARHGSLRSAADEVGIAGSTARWHMKRVYRKTGLSGQAKFIHHFATAPEAILVASPPAAGVRTRDE